MRGHKILMFFKTASFPQWRSDILAPNTQEQWDLSLPVQKQTIHTTFI